MAAPGDNPIEGPGDDLLEREPLAATIAAEIRSVDASEGCVVAVMGPWGSGKTSLVNLVRCELAKEPPVVILDFNPWMFSGADQLIDSFFRELSAQLGLKGDRLGKIADEVKAYGDLLSPVADAFAILSALPFGGILDRFRNAGSAIKNFQDHRKLGVSEQRRKLAGNLKELDQPIVVVLDDIDRLTTTEIRDMFKLVRLTASFPNIVYLLAFDRKRVEEALSEEGINGRSYLEKIVQVTFDIPVLSQPVLFNQLGRALSDALDEFTDTRFTSDLWADIAPEVILPLIRNMRDVRRYCASARGTVRSLGADIELTDVLALEAVRVFMPDAFACLIEVRGALTDTSFRSGAEEYKAQIKRLLEFDDGSSKGVISALIERIFPSAQRHISNTHHGPEWLKKWIRARRVAHPDILGLYLERVVGDNLRAFMHAETAFTLLTLEPALDVYLRSLEPGRLEDVIAALENYEGDYPPGAVPVAVTVLLNLMPILPERPRGFMEMNERLVVGRVILRLLRQLEGPDEVERVVRNVLPKLSTLSARFDLLTTVGHRENAGHGLMSIEAAEELEIELAESVRTSEPNVLAEEWDLARLLFHLQQKLPEGTPILPTFDNLNLNTKVLLAAVANVRSQPTGSRVVTTSPRLNWNLLLALYGSEEALEHAISSLEESHPSNQRLIETIALAKRYLSGSPPKDFEDN